MTTRAKILVVDDKSDIVETVPYLDHRMAEELFRHRVLRLQQNQGLLSEERIHLLLSWDRSGFSSDDSVRIPKDCFLLTRSGESIPPRADLVQDPIVGERSADHRRSRRPEYKWNVTGRNRRRPRRLRAT